MSHDSTLQQAEPRLQDFPQYVPSYKQKVGAYMRIETSAPTSSFGQGSSCNYGSVLNATFREDNQSSPCQPPHSTYGGAADDQATYFNKNRMYKRRIGLSLFHLLMSRCQALQCIVNASECKPQTQKSTLDIHINYSKILSFAQEARKIAEELESVALEARSAYWAGRGCGGLRDWQTATIHFTNAVRLDASYSNLEHTRAHYGGLLRHEKEDVEFLLQNAKQRYNEWTHKTKKPQKKQDGQDVETANLRDMRDPSWTPNRDFRNWAAKQQLDKNRKAGRRRNVFLPKEGQEVRKLWKYEIPIIRKRLEILDGKNTFRRTLNADEWFYVLRGNLAIKDDNISTNHQDEKEPGSKTDITTTPASSPSICSSKQSLFDESRNLDDELQQSGYLETRPPSASSFERITQPGCEEDLPPSPSSSHDLINAQTTLHIDPL